MLLVRCALRRLKRKTIIPNKNKPACKVFEAGFYHLFFMILFCKEAITEVIHTIEEFIDIVL